MKTRTELLYHEIARRLLLKQSDEEISQATGLSTRTVRSVLEKPDFRSILEDVRDRAFGPVDRTIQERTKSITEQLQDVAQESFDRLRALLLQSSSEAIIRDVAQDFLDRAGYGKVQPQQQTVFNIGTLEASILVDALKREREARERFLTAERNPEKLAKPVTEHVAERDPLRANDQNTGPSDTAS